MFNKIILNCIGLIFLISLSNTSSFSQVNSTTEKVEAVRTANCEYASTVLEGFADLTKADKTVIIVSYKGRRDTMNEIALRRSYNAKIYLTEALKETTFSRPSEKVINAVGIDEKEEGRLDFYVDGELKLTMLFLKDRDLTLRPCYIDFKDYCKDKIKRLFYPCVDRVKRKPKK